MTPSPGRRLGTGTGLRARGSRRRPSPRRGSAGPRTAAAGTPGTGRGPWWAGRRGSRRRRGPRAGSPLDPQEVPPDPGQELVGALLTGVVLIAAVEDPAVRERGPHEPDRAVDRRPVTAVVARAVVAAQGGQFDAGWPVVTAADEDRVGAVEGVDDRGPGTEEC